MSTTRVYVDFASGYLADNPLQAQSTASTSSNYTLLPGLSGGQYLALVLDPAETVGPQEIVYVTGYVPGSTACTIVRGCEGTAPRQHTLGEPWVASPVASDLTNPRLASAQPATPDVGQMYLDASYFSANVWTGSRWAAGGMPVGSVIAWTVPANYPLGWLPMVGQTLSTSDYPELFALLGTTYGVGAGAGTATFSLPNATSRTLVGAFTSGATVPPGATEEYVLGSTGGEAAMTLALTNMPSHSHTVNDPGHNHYLDATGDNDPRGYSVATEYHSANTERYLATTGTIAVEFDYIQEADTNVTVATAGAGTAFVNMPPFLALEWLIRV